MDGASCGTNLYCSGGVCKCGPPGSGGEYAMCGGNCVDLYNDTSNCNSCGHMCPAIATPGEPCSCSNIAGCIGEVGGVIQTSNTATVDSATIYAVQVFVPGAGAVIAGPPGRITFSTSPAPTAMIAGIYADAGGKPGNLVSSGTSTGGTDVYSASPGHIASGTYWIAVSANVTPGTQSKVSTGLPCITMAHGYDGTLPASWSSSGSCSPLGIYLVGANM
jgi:hypothetical protein